MKKPIIALTCRIATKDSSTLLYDTQSYFNAIELAGGFPILLPLCTDEQAEQALQCADALAVTGGVDCDPSLYHKPNTYSLDTDPILDQSDIALYRAFNKAGKPILGICRGIQIINAAEGGTLIQDIGKEAPGCLEHNQLKRDITDREAFSHKVSFTENSLLHSIYSDTCEVNSFHHQCIDIPSPSFTVTCHSEDGIIEGIEKKDVIAVQWHPENLCAHADHLALFKWLVNQASAKQTV